MSHTELLAALRADLPILKREIDGRPLIYLDSAASSLTPGRVLAAMHRFYERSRANVHRGKHLLSEEASDLYEEARRRVAAFVNAPPSAVVFTAGTTAALNMVALGLRLQQDDVVVSTTAEHHALLLPFIGRCELRLIDVGAEGWLSADVLATAIDARTRVVAFAHASNVTGAIQDTAALVKTVRARAPAARVIIDAAQAAPHLPLDVDALDADFVAFSGHKMLGPTGIGVLTGKVEALDALSFELRGGGTVRMVQRDGYSLRGLPQKLEPGTPNIAGAIGIGEACACLMEMGMESVRANGERLAERLVAAANDLAGARLLGPPPGAPRLPLVSLVPRSSTVSADHLAMVLSDTHGVMVRSGHHCCHPYFDSLGVPAALRASAGVYTADEEIDGFAVAARDVLCALIG